MARAPVLTMTRNFISTLMWAPDEVLDAITLVLAVTHVKDSFTNVPFVLATGEAESGKSTLTKNIPLLLASRPWIVDKMTTDQGLKNKFLSENDRPDTVLFDDASKIFGEDGRRGRTSSVYQMAVNGYEDTAKVSVSRNGSTVDVPAYIVGFMNGLGDVVPGDLRTRCIKVKIVKKPGGIRTRNARSVPVRQEAEPLKRELHRWAVSNRRVMEQFVLNGLSRVHPRMNDRLQQIWGPLFAVAHAAGGDWPKRCLDAFLILGLDESEKPVLQRDEQALLDAGKIALTAGSTVLFLAELVPVLREIPDDFYRKVDDDYLVTDLLPRALGPAKRVRGKVMDGGDTAAGEGWMIADVLERAAALHEELYPPPPDTGPDPVQQALTLNRTGGRR